MKPACISCLLIGQLLCQAVQCQYYFNANNQPEPELMWEAGLAAGTMNCLTDLGGNNGRGKKFIKDINWNQSGFCAGVFLSATWQSVFAIKLQAGWGQVAGTDEVLKNSDGIARNRYLRHLHFKSDIIELSASGELHLVALLNKHGNLPLFSPYLIAGIGCFHYNPQARFNNIWVDLRPLHTEGQGFKEYPERQEYSSISWCLPMGMGVKYDAGRLINCRLELLYRVTGTDYLDDVSKNYADPLFFNSNLPPARAAMAIQLADRSNEIAANPKNTTGAIRGNPSNKDAYFSIMLSAGIALGRLPRK